MTTASASEGDRPWPAWRVKLAQLGHYESRYSDPLALGFGVIWTLMVWLPPHGTASTVLFVVAVMLGASYFGLQWGGREHSRLLMCDRCLSYHTILNPQTAVTAHRRQLKRCHSPRRRRYAHIIGVGMAVSFTAPPLLLETPAHLAAQIVGTALVLASTGLACWFGRDNIWHSRLRPWCPWCHPRRDKDTDYVTPDPTPDPTGVLPQPVLVG